MKTGEILQTEFQKDKGYSPYTCPESLTEYVKWLEEKIAYSAVEQKEMPSDGWISVKDRLPEKGERVIIICEAGIQIGWLTLKNNWVIFGDTIINEVLYYKPLPEPPKEKDK